MPTSSALFLNFMLFPLVTNKEVSCCNFCHAKEGHLQPYTFIPVFLKRIEILGTSKYACQLCYLRNKRLLKKVSKKEVVHLSEVRLNQLRKFATLFVALLILTLLFSSLLLHKI